MIHFFVTAVALMACDRTPRVEEIPTTRFGISIELTVERETVRAIEIWVSPDQGRSWRRITVLDPSATRFLGAALPDGEYWYTARVAFKDGNFDPPYQGRPDRVTRVRFRNPPDYRSAAEAYWQTIVNPGAVAERDAHRKATDGKAYLLLDVSASTTEFRLMLGLFGLDGATVNPHPAPAYARGWQRSVPLCEQ